MRDLVVGVTVVLSDGTIAKAGGKVIKNVAGYDLGKLFAGAFGTLGLIAEVTVRLHPRPARTATVVARSDDPTQLAAAAAALAHAPLEADCLDLWWDARHRTPAPCSSASAAPTRARGSRKRPRLLRKAGGLAVDIETDDDACWEAQRAAQRGDVVVKVSALPTALPDGDGRHPGAGRDAGGPGRSRAGLDPAACPGANRWRR